MNNINSKVQEYLESLEEEIRISYHGENEISDRIKGILKKDEAYKNTECDYAEHAAFGFFIRGRNDELSWGTYYGPMSVFPNAAGQMMEYPSIKRVDKEMLQYWAKRAEESKNPILSSRYADLVVDFSQKVIEKNPNINMFQIVIDSNITICKKLLAHPLDCKIKIKRALDLAIQTSDTCRINKTKDAIIQLEKEITKDDKPGLWGFSLKWLLLNSSKKITLSAEEKSDLVHSVECKLKIMEKDTWTIENAVPLLAEHYANEKDEENLMRVLGILENAIKTDKRINSSPLLITSFYKNILEAYEKYRSRFPEVEKAYKRLLQEFGSLKLDWEKSMKRISVTAEIKKEEIDNHLRSIFGETKNNELETVMVNIALVHLQQKNALKKAFNNASSEHPFQFMVSKQLISGDGAPPVAILSSVDEDYENNFKHYATEHTQFDSIFLSITMNELRKQFNQDQIIEYFANSAFFKEENSEYLERAISAYWKEDYIVSSHLFIPLIESGIRNLIKLCGGTIYNPNKLDGYTYVSLNNLLEKNTKIFECIFSGLGDSILFYFRLMLTEKIGMNLRNDFAHGDNKKNFFKSNVSDRLFHILIFLATVKEEKQQKPNQ